MNYRERRPAYVDAHRVELGEVLNDQADHILAMWEARANVAIFDRERWDPALRDRLLSRTRTTAVDFGRAVADELDAGFNDGALDAFLISSAALGAGFLNDALSDELKAAMGAEDTDAAVRLALSIFVGATLDRLATSTVTTSANFGMTTGAQQGGARAKVWVVNSGRPRSIHAEMSGQTTGLGEAFSNGMQWPGDPAGGAENNANCRCSVDFEA